MWFFKYGQREHLEDFFQRGSVQIGTLRSYDEETHGPAIGDECEGISYHTLHDNNISEYLDCDDLNREHLAGWIVGPGYKGNLTRITNVGFNYAIFCVSHVLDREVCADFSDKYDAAMIIDRPYVFFHELSTAFENSGLVESIEFQHVADVHYRPRELLASEDVIEAFVKEERYAHQAETRAIWNIGQPKESFYRFTAPRARRACRLLYLADMPTRKSEASIDEQRRDLLNAYNKATCPI